MGEDIYLDSYWEDRDFGLDPYDDFNEEYDPDEYDDGDDFPLYLEYPEEDMQDLDPPF